VLNLYQKIVPDNRYFGGLIQKLYILHRIYGEFHGHRTYGKVQGLIKPLGTRAERGKKERKCLTERMSSTGSTKQTMMIDDW
jgi:hypothetical protein